MGVLRSKKNRKLLGWALFAKVFLFVLLYNSTVSAVSKSKVFGFEPPPSTTIIAPRDKVIYLTFDDGPTPPITDKILDILKVKNVNATFFIIGKKIRSNQALLKRMVGEGNGIGLHSYTHDYKKIYSSNDAFICEMSKTDEELLHAIDISAKCIRFPLGSKNHLNKYLYIKLSLKDYRIFDWNARLTDGVHPYCSPEVFYKEAIATAKNRTTVFMLMHCDVHNQNTCKALPKIIDYFKKNRYTFKIIDNDTPEYFFKFKRFD